MQAIILAAGNSTRTLPLTVTRPKSLLKIANKSILAHNLEQLEDLVDEVILVVGFKAEMIKATFGNKYKQITIKYVEQKEQLGTGHALLQAEEYAKERFIVLGGDDLFFREDLLKLKNEKYVLLAQEVEKPENFGIVEEEKGYLKKIVEKSSKPISNLANIGCYLLDRNIFSLIKQVKKSERNEYELTDAINELAKKEKLKVIRSQYWIPIGYPWDLLNANQILLSKIKSSEIKGNIEEGVTIRGEIIVGKGTIIKGGSYIEGPVIIGESCIIGPNAYIRPDTAIGNNCKIRGELFDTIVMDNSVAKHNCYLGHSVIGEDVNISAGTITSDYRHDGKSNITIVKGKKVDSGRIKLGAFIGDHVRTGINTSVYPGRKIWPNKTTLPGEIVKEDVK
ncbi:MAG: sugar phosphate nucleotidyltransferase [Candidatus Woesearchaeota archaeon]|nr:sugar phosphate nucleotidyltransferase [Candidatus Woesearchaeota archaeon]